MWSEYLSAAEMRQFWCCPVCGNMFETLDEVDPKTKMPIGLAQQFLPSLLVA
ncbi:MAG: hypothetical protein OJF62_003006 [Pseudolabrys sp.]|jgi:rubrerythrin|nr:hypothetical protein [Pseudolabrys sp.]